MAAQPTETMPADIRNLLLDSANLSLDQLPMLPVIFDRVGTHLAERLRHLAWSPPHITLNGVESTRIGDALDPYELNAVAGVFYVPAWDNRVIIGFDRDFVFTMVDLLFGGDGSERPFDDKRVFSTIELQLAQSLFEHVALALQAAFGLVTNVRFRFERIETRMDFAGAGRRNTPAVAARYILQAINRGGEMFVVVPQPALTPLRQALSKIIANEPVSPDPYWAKKIGDEVSRTEVSIRAVIESHDFTLANIANLKVGQVLKLQATTSSRVKVESSEQPLFWSYLGQNEGFHTLCIDEPIDPEREFVNDVLSR
jgi:flagellar motor switch protein FliM